MYQRRVRTPSRLACSAPVAIARRIMALCTPSWRAASEAERKSGVRLNHRLLPRIHAANFLDP